MCCGGRLQGARRQIDGKRGRITPEQGMLDTPSPLEWQSPHLENAGFATSLFSDRSVVPRPPAVLYTHTQPASPWDPFLTAALDKMHVLGPAVESVRLWG